MVTSKTFDLSCNDDNRQKQLITYLANYIMYIFWNSINNNRSNNTIAHRNITERKCALNAILISDCQFKKYILEMLQLIIYIYPATHAHTRARTNTHTCPRAHNSVDSVYSHAKNMSEISALDALPWVPKVTVKSCRSNLLHNNQPNNQPTRLWCS